MATIKDVAKAAGVSTATVSRILSTPGWGKEDTRQRVMEAVEQLQYQPNALARQLRTQETKTIVAIVPTLDNSFYHEVIYGIESEAEAHGYQVFIADLHGQPSFEGYYLSALQQRKVDGIISLSANAARRITQQVPDGCPMVLAIQSTADSPLPSVSVDNTAASAVMMKHLIRMGHRRIAHITDNSDIVVYQDRERGYISSLEENGIPLDPGLIQRGNPTLQGGFDLMNALLDTNKDITAVFAAGDAMAMGAISALRKRNLRVPEDIAVVGFDDIATSSFFIPALTTIRQPQRMIGQCAFRKLLAVIRKEPVPLTAELLPFELVIRESCGFFL